MVQTWNRMLLKDHIEAGSSEVVYHKMNDYKLSRHTQLAINYHDDPILGEYCSLWKDAELGWVLSSRTTKAVINRFMIETNISIITLHKTLEHQCQVSKHHVLFKSQFVLFSVNGYRGKSTSWFNFHHLAEAKAIPKRRLLIILKDGFNYEFKRVAPNIEGRIGEALRMHDTVMDMTKALYSHLGEVIARNQELHQLKHLREGQVRISLKRAVAFFNSYLHRQTQLDCLRLLADDLEIQLTNKDLHGYTKQADKNNSLY